MRTVADQDPTPSENFKKYKINAKSNTSILLSLKYGLKLFKQKLSDLLYFLPLSALALIFVFCKVTQDGLCSLATNGFYGCLYRIWNSPGFKRKNFFSFSVFKDCYSCFSLNDLRDSGSPNVKRSKFTTQALYVSRSALFGLHA